MPVRRAGSLAPKPWRNGHGLTRDILAGPGGEADWMLSLADLERDAPFSSFPGMDRTFTLVAGGPVRFLFEDGGELACPPLVPILFPGERPLACRLGSGPARALNVIADRARFAASVAVLRLADGHAARLAAGTTALHCITGRASVDGAVLEAGDTLVGEAPMVRAEAGPATLLRVALDSTYTRAPRP